jgi:transmembrane sensor
MNKDENPVRRLVAQQAVEWHLANRGGLDREQAAQFAEWLKASPLHVEEYLTLAQLGADLQAARTRQGVHLGLPAGELEALIERARTAPEPDDIVIPFPAAARREPVRTRTFGLAASALVALVGAAIALALWLPATATLHRASGHGQRLSEHLPDQSLMTLDADSVADVRYTVGERRIELAQGQGLFEVAHNRLRPFRVQAGGVVVTAVGTRFDVQTLDNVAIVTVLEGRVRVAPADLAAAGPTSHAQVEVVAGQRLRIVAGKLVEDPRTINAAQSIAWLDGRLECDEVPLAEVAAEVSRYAAKPVVVTGTALRALPISGGFAPHDLDAFLAFVASLEGTQLRVTASQVEIGPR